MAISGTNTDKILSVDEKDKLIECSMNFLTSLAKILKVSASWEEKVLIPVISSEVHFLVMEQMKF